MHTEDQLILVDLDDVPIGSAGKAEVHRRGLLHRAFSVFLTDGERMLLQRRSRGKYHSGGLWANACCSHPRAGESLEQAVPRRLKEELGISCPVEELFSFHYFSQYGPQLFEYELDHVFLGRWVRVRSVPTRRRSRRPAGSPSPSSGRSWWNVPPGFPPGFSSPLPGCWNT